MDNNLALARLMAWLSPVFPTGSFAYSSGLETAATSGLVLDERSLKNWLDALLSHGRLRNDAIFLQQSLSLWDDRAAIGEINDLALASVGSAELLLETTAQGAAFFEAIQSWPEISALAKLEPVALPVTVGAACGATS
ncbi:MAG: urease accessory protein UreF, partial [Rhizobiaceae bacterium]